MSERIKPRKSQGDFAEFTRLVGDARWPIVLNARFVVAVEDASPSGAMITVLGLDGVVWVTQSRAEVCAWLLDRPPS